MAAGLIGVGGGEFRIPILLYILGLPITSAVAVNLLVGLFTVAASSIMRLRVGLLEGGAIDIALAMSLTSIVGSYVGAASTGRVEPRLLKRVLAVFLVAIGVKIGLEPFMEAPGPMEIGFSPLEEAILAAIIGLLIGVISGMLGVAGGELRIPALIYIFGQDIRVAGTTSLLISIPTVATGLIKHQRMRHMGRGAAKIAAIMGAASILGASIGAQQAVLIEKDILKMLLSAILIMATVRMVTKP